MYEIDSNDKDLQRAVKELFEWYDEYLDKDLKQVLEKLRDIKPDNLTDDEGEALQNAYNSFGNLKETLGEITEIMHCTN
jgi:predicted DNA binding protein